MIYKFWIFTSSYNVDDMTSYSNYYGSKFESYLVIFCLFNKNITLVTLLKKIINVMIFYIICIWIVSIDMEYIVENRVTSQI